MIQEVEKFKYLGYIVKTSGEEKVQIKELKKNGNVVLKQVWGLGERRFRDDFEKRMMLFKYLVLEVIMYEQKCEVEKREKCQRKECKRDT